MNRTIKLIAAAAALAMTAACQQEVIPDGVNGDVAVNLSVSVPEVATKSIADGTNVDILYYEVYNADMTKRLVTGSTPRTSEKNFELNLTLVQDQTYNFLFWAQVNGKNYYTVSDLRNVTVSYGSDADGNTVAEGNDESRAAFFAAEKFAVGKNTLTEDIYLKRPFAQLNFGTETFESSMDEDVTVDGSAITVTNVSTRFDVAAKVGSSAAADLTKVTFTATGCPSDPAKLTLDDNSSYEYLSMNYFFVGGDEAAVTVDAVFNTSVGDVAHSIPSVPVAENYRTNIVGDLLFNQADFKIIVDETFTKPDKDIFFASDAASLVEAISQMGNGGEVILQEDIVLSAGVAVPGKVVVLNGGGKSIVASAVPTVNGIVRPAGGAVVKNLTIDADNQNTVDRKGLRAIYITSEGKYVIENVVTDGTTYAINVNTTQPVTLQVSNSTLQGWTSYGSSTTATFNKVKFTNGNYAYFRPYGNTFLTECSFQKDFKVDFSELVKCGTVIRFDNCQYDGVVITAANIESLGFVENYDASVVEF